jgi:hypothetical protein
MRCFLMRSGHIAAVEELPGMTDQEAVEKCRAIFEARKSITGFNGFEVWDRARMVIQEPPPTVPNIHPD